MQHDHPVLTVPAGIERDLPNGKVCVGNRLACQTAVADLNMCIEKMNTQIHGSKYHGSIAIRKNYKNS